MKIFTTLFSSKNNTCRTCETGYAVILTLSLGGLLAAHGKTIQVHSLTLPALSNRVVNIKTGHPSLFGTIQDFQRVRDSAIKHAYGKPAFEKVIKDSEVLLPQKPCSYVKEGRRLLGVCRAVLFRATTLSMAFRLTGERKYLERCQSELLAAADFPDWNPSHYLDVAEMTLALAIGYDWLYHELDPDAREKIYTAILEKGLRNSMESTGWWIKAKNNWGQVCHAGLMAGAFATLERNPKISAFIIHRAITHLPISMAVYNPNGAYPEGPGYWSYGTGFNVLALDMLFSRLGTDFGLSDLPGFNETVEYLDIVTGPSGATFNYADGGSGRSTDPAMWWFARHYKRVDILQYFEVAALKKYCAKKLSPGRYGNRLFPLTLLWMQEPPGNQTPSRTPLHWSSESAQVITVHRTSWDNAKALFVGFKGGSPSDPHGHMDAGSFVLDYAGVRWAHDIGAENYHKIESLGMNLWSSRQDGDRWKIFRLNNLSHNTLVIDEQLQVAKGRAILKSFKTAPLPETVLDLSGVYKGQAACVERCGQLLDSGALQISDTLKGLKPGAKVRWQMMTRADPELTGSASVRLVEKGHSITLSIQHEPPRQWRIVDASQPRNSWDSQNRRYKLICFESEAPKNGELNLCVLITPQKR